jgi:5-(carboxyamino)imidazole ribonucleotide mutase
VAASETPLVGVIMGSDSDLPTMQGALDVLAEFGVPHEVRVVSAHRTPDVMYEYARGAADRGLRVIIAGAGGAAHLPGMTASMTSLPVIGVPVPLQQLDGLDSLLSIVQMPDGIPVATVGVGKARNAGLLAVRILGAHDDALRSKLDEHRAALDAAVREKDSALSREKLSRD